MIARSSGEMPSDLHGAAKHGTFFLVKEEATRGATDDPDGAIERSTADGARGSTSMSGSPSLEFLQDLAHVSDRALDELGLAPGGAAPALPVRFEVRRLHDEYRYTTVYVTHDQSEAMTTADLIAVMNAGKIEQLGSPEDIYARPRSEFVARFIGSSNIVRGKALDAGHITVAGIPVSCTGTGLAAGNDAAISIRQHEIRIDTAEPTGERRNVLPAVVARNVFLGNSRDYMVEIGDGTQIRVVTSPEENIQQGSKVWLQLPAERCRVLEH